MNYNKIILAGNITRDPDLSYTPSQMPVCKFGMAVNKKFGDKETTCFVDCVSFKTTAENINKYFRKGDPIFIDGELQFESWTAQDGTKRNKHSIFVANFQFVKPLDKDRTQYQHQPTQQEHQPTQQDSLLPDDDDIPF